jgi:hypothetical protein
MSCILNIVGENFDVDTFVAESQLVPYKISYKGTPRFKSNPDSKKHEFTGCSIEVSSATFDEFNAQVTDAIQYLKDNSEKLKMISLTNDIEHAFLDFGVDYDEDKFVQGRFFPHELLKIAAALGISIKLSTYNHYKQAE